MNRIKPILFLTLLVLSTLLLPRLLYAQVNTSLEIQALNDFVVYSKTAAEHREELQSFAQEPPPVSYSNTNDDTANNGNGTMFAEMQDLINSVVQSKTTTPPKKDFKKPSVASVPLNKKQNETPPQDNGPKIFIKKIILQGNQTLPEAEIFKFTQPLENRETSLTELKKAAFLITQLYRSKGFLTTRAFIPPQKIIDGEVTLQIMQGKIGSITLKDNKWFKDSVYLNYFSKVKPNSNFQSEDLETSLYYLNQKEDRRAKAYLMPGEEAGTSDLVLKAEERYPLHAYYEFNNRGTKLTNRARNTVGFEATNLTGVDDTLDFGTSAGQEGSFQAGWAQYTLPIHETGTEFSLAANYSHTKLVREFRPLKIGGESFTINPSILQNIIRKRTVALDGYFGLEIKDSKSTISSNTSYYDRMRVLKIGPRLSVQDNWGKTIFNADMHVGLGSFLGGLHSDDPHASRPNTGDNFVYYSGEIARLQSLPLSSYLLLQGSWQWSPTDLTSLEQFRAGGMYSVRGYPEAESTGDSGYTLTSELNFPVPFVPANFKLPKIKVPFGEAVRLVGFYDLGETNYHNRSVVSEAKDHFLMGAGFGLRLNLGPYTSVRLDRGYPIGDKSSDKNNPQLYLSVRSGF